jgi:hypothetical protein
LNNDEQRELELEGLINLIGALFRLTSQDIRLGDNKAKEFLDSEWFIEICNSLQLGPERVKLLILKSPVKSRVSYE